jgi:hypothetical protein
MKIIVRYDDSAGNDSVGNMWSETAIFDDTKTIKDIYEWLESKRGGVLRVNLILTVGEEIK